VLEPACGHFRKQSGKGLWLFGFNADQDRAEVARRLLQVLEPGDVVI